MLLGKFAYELIPIAAFAQLRVTLSSMSWLYRSLPPGTAAEALEAADIPKLPRFPRESNKRPEVQPFWKKVIGPRIANDSPTHGQ